MFSSSQTKVHTNGHTELPLLTFYFWWRVVQKQTEAEKNRQIKIQP